MRVLYGVHGYGRGHATRTFAVLPHLAREHQVLVLAGGDAYPALSGDFPTVRIPTLGFAYGRKGGQRSNWQTFRRNASAALDIFWRGPVFDMIRETVEDFAPDVIISDAETWTHSVAKALHIPRISFDHIGIMAYCQPEIEWSDRFEGWFDTRCYRLLMGRPDRVLVSSFYEARPRWPTVKVVSTLPRQAVREQKPTDGEHLLAYFNRGDDQLNPAILSSLENAGAPVHIYGSSRRGRHGSLTFLPLSNLPFLEDLASCRAVISTAGNQLIGEAIFLGKPCLVMPERCVEQRLNAAAVERMGIGMRVSLRQFHAGKIREFLERRPEFVRTMSENVRDGLEESLSALRQFMHELVPSAEAPAGRVEATDALRGD
jgi:uncharacterized protein (TIGR00661 family)